jgi:hypothetical protein
MPDAPARIPGARTGRPGSPRKILPKTSEEALQFCVHQFLKVSLPDDVTYTAVDHAAKLSRRQGGTRKARGVKRGQADIRLILPPYGQSAEIELKSSDGRQSPEQKDWQKQVHRSGGLYAVCKSLDEVVATLTGWGVKLRSRL